MAGLVYLFICATMEFLYVNWIRGTNLYILHAHMYVAYIYCIYSAVVLLIATPFGHRFAFFYTRASRFRVHCTLVCRLAESFRADTTQPHSAYKGVANGLTYIHILVYICIVCIYWTCVCVYLDLCWLWYKAQRRCGHFILYETPCMKNIFHFNYTLHT